MDCKFEICSNNSLARQSGQRLSAPQGPAVTSRNRNTTMAAALDVVLPGDVIPQHALPTGTGKKKTLTLGPGLRHIPPNTVTSTVAGTLVTDNRKNAALVEYNSGRVRLLPHQFPFPLQN